MLRYGAMHAEYYGLLFGRKIRPAHGALHALNAHMGPVNHLRHDDRMVSRRSDHGDIIGRPLRSNFFCAGVTNAPACALMYVDVARTAPRTRLIWSHGAIPSVSRHYGQSGRWTSLLTHFLMHAPRASPSL